MLFAQGGYLGDIPFDKSHITAKLQRKSLNSKYSGKQYVKERFVMPGPTGHLLGTQGAGQGAEGKGGYTR